MRRMWRRFRRLPGAGQLALGAIVLAGYSAGLIVLLGGDGETTGNGGREPVTRNDFERRIAAFIVSPRTRAGQPTDVNDFRTPRVRRVRCEGEQSCVIFYASGLPGGGRILEDQQSMIQNIFVETAAEKLTITAVRGTPDETGVPPKDDEETSPGRILVQTSCDRRGTPAAQIARLRPEELQAGYCKLAEAENGGPGRARDAPGTDLGDSGPTGPPTQTQPERNGTGKPETPPGG